MGNLYLSGPVPVEVVTPRQNEGKAADALAAKSRSGGDIPEMSQQPSRILAAIKQSNSIRRIRWAENRDLFWLRPGAVV